MCSVNYEENTVSDNNKSFLCSVLSLNFRYVNTDNANSLYCSALMIQIQYLVIAGKIAEESPHNFS